MNAEEIRRKLGNCGYLDGDKWGHAAEVTYYLSVESQRDLFGDQADSADELQEMAAWAIRERFFFEIK
jgi:hypothetical protein